MKADTPGDLDLSFRTDLSPLLILFAIARYRCRGGNTYEEP